VLPQREVAPGHDHHGEYCRAGGAKLQESDQYHVDEYDREAGTEPEPGIDPPALDLEQPIAGGAERQTDKKHQQHQL